MVEVRRRVERERRETESAEEEREGRGRGGERREESEEWVKWGTVYLGLNIADDNLYFLEYPGSKLAQ